MEKKQLEKMTSFSRNIITKPAIVNTKVKHSKKRKQKDIFAKLLPGFVEETNVNKFMNEQRSRLAFLFKDL